MKIVVIICLAIIIDTFQQSSQSLQSNISKTPLVSGSGGILVGTLQTQCANTPYWNLNICGIECNTCQSGLSSCNSCPSKFTLSSGTCIADQSYYYMKTYCTGNTFSFQQILAFSFVDDYLTTQNVVTFCTPDLYQFQMMGLFQQADVIYYSTTFPQSTTGVKVRLLFFSQLPNINIVISVNFQQIFSYTFSQLVALNTIYQPSTASTATSYIQVAALTSSSANNLIKIIDTGFYSIDVSIYDFDIEVTYLDDHTSTQFFWAFSDFAVIAKKCENCVSKRLKSIGRQVGIAIGVTVAILVVLIFILYMSILYERSTRLASMKKQNSSQQLQKQAQQNFNQILSYPSQHIIKGNNNQQKQMRMDQQKLMRIDQQKQDIQYSFVKNNTSKNVKEL